MANPVTGAENVRWDFTFLYSDLDDPRIDADVEEWCGLAKRFHETHAGKLSAQLSAALEDMTALDELRDKFLVYLFLRQSTETGNQKIRSRIADVEKRVSQVVAESLNFFDHELAALPEAAIEAQAMPIGTVRKHLPLIRHERSLAKHLLKEDIEQALIKRSPYGPQSWADFFDEVEADLRFPWENEQKTLTEMLKILTDSQTATVRAAALKVINDGLGGSFLKFSAQTLSMIVGKKEIEDKDRGYGHPMAKVNLRSKIPDDVVEALHGAVTREAAPIAQRYYRMKAKLLGLKRLAWSDRNAPMPFSDDTIVPFEKAVETVTAAYQSFSPTLAGLVREQFANKRIDAPAFPGRRGGAFNYSIVLPGHKPVSFTFLNYQGSNGDVATLAHELGHGVHGLLAGEAQGALQFRAPMAYAETASIFGEMTTFNFLKADLIAKGGGDALLALLCDKIDDMLNSAVRQISFSNFERKVHGARRRLTTDELNELWMECTRELYGADGDVFTYENTSNLWSYVSHFHRPFYVYAYSFGELLTQSLYAKRESLGDRFEPLYLDLLRAGGTKNPTELLAPFGLDPANPDFWAAGIRVSIGALVDEAERVAKHLGKL